MFGSVCLVLAILSLVMFPICRRLADDASAVPFAVTFVIFLSGGILSHVFSNIVGMLAMAVIVTCYMVWFFRK